MKIKDKNSNLGDRFLLFGRTDITRSVALAGFPAKLEPPGLIKDGSKKRRDGYTYDSFKTGKPLAGPLSQVNILT